MEIIFHAHHANVSDRMRKRAESAVRRAARRMARAVDGIIRFEQDGPVKRVEIVLHAPRQRNLIARGEGRYFGPAFAGAGDSKLNARLIERRLGHKGTARNMRSIARIIAKLDEEAKG